MTEGGKEVALVVGKPPPQKNPVLKAVIFLKKKKSFTQVTYTPQLP